MCGFVTCCRELISFGFSKHFIPLKETQFHISKDYGRENKAFLGWREKTGLRVQLENLCVSHWSYNVYMKASPCSIHLHQRELSDGMFTQCPERQSSFLNLQLGRLDSSGCQMWSRYKIGNFLSGFHKQTITKAIHVTTITVCFIICFLFHCQSVLQHKLKVKFNLCDFINASGFRGSIVWLSVAWTKQAYQAFLNYTRDPCWHGLYRALDRHPP